MTIPRGYVANHKIWDRMGRVSPITDYSHSERPHFESMPGTWLPTVRYDQEYEYWIVVSVGKVVALDGNGHLVPAGLRKAWNVAAGTTILTYTATDVAQSVVDLTTGAVVAAATSYTEAQVTAALKERGLLRADQRAMDFISKPVGIASYNYYKAPGTDWYNPRNLFQHGFRPQANVAITCDYVAQYPLVPAVVSGETMANDRMAGANGLLEDYVDGTIARAVGWFSSTQIHELVKYASTVAAGDDVVCYMFANYPVAAITTDTPITHSNSQLIHEVSAVDSLSAAGDYFLDYDLGLLFLYEAGGNALPTGWAVTDTITYYHYNAVAGAQITTYASATGNLEFGDFLTYDTNSNLIRAQLDIANAEGYTAAFALYALDPDYSAALDADISRQLEQAIDNHMQGIVGQVIGVNEFPRSALERVGSAYTGYTAANMRTPGSATGGRNDALTYANASTKMVIVNLIFR